MPLFKCPKCGCIENTACGEYLMGDTSKETGHSDTVHDDRGWIVEWCSECFTGKWHGRFPKQTPEEAGLVMLEDGYYGPPGGWK